MTVALPRSHDGSGVALFESALTAPWRAGMAADDVPLTGGRFVVASPRREPVLLVRLRRGLADEAVVVRLTVGGVDLPPVVFSPFTAEGTLLPGFRPVPATGSDSAGPFTVDARVYLVTGPEQWSASPSTPAAHLGQDEAAEVVSSVVLEGRFARLLFLGTLEKQRCIRQAREISALRHRTLAHHGALDAFGRDLGVPRLPDETDEHLRARLAIYSRWRLPTPSGFADALNGPGLETAPNAGLPALAGISSRFRVVEETNELSVSTLLVAVGQQGATERARFHEVLKADHLIDLDLPMSTSLPHGRRAFLESVRTTLQQELTRPAAGSSRHLAPLTAVCLDSAVRVMRALGHREPLELARAHDPAGGSRYELGLGVDLAGITGAALDVMADQVDELAATGDSDLALLAEAMDPRPASEDPIGRWLFEPCGFRTVHLLADGRVHLSPVPSHGLWIEGPTDVAVGATASYESRYHASDAAQGVHVRALEAAADALELMTDDGLTPLPTVLSPAELRTTVTALSTAAASPPVPAAWSALATSGVVTTDSRSLATSVLDDINLDQVVGFVYQPAAVTALGPGAALRDEVAARADSLTRGGFYTVRSVVDTAGRLLVLASVSVLPGASGKQGEPPPATFYWYTSRLPRQIPGGAGPVVLEQGRGGRSFLRAVEPGLAMLVCIGYARRGLADPFEVRIEVVDDDALLDMDQYGYLMNLLEAVYPIGIEINTFDVRRNHVDADGDGRPEFLTSRVSRTYHRYRHARPIGALLPRDTRGATS